MLRSQRVKREERPPPIPASSARQLSTACQLSTGLT